MKINIAVNKNGFYDIELKIANTRSLDGSIEFFRVLDELINERFKFYGIFILKEVYNYLSVKEIK